MRLRHMITCSEAVNPPVTAGSFMTEMERVKPLQHEVRLANLYNLVTLGECSCLLLWGRVLVVADQRGGFHRALYFTST